MARYHLGWEDVEGNPSDAGGKGVRAGLCLLACEAAGGRWQSAVPGAAAVELVHAFSLVHDDIQDGDRERHHRPTVWAVWGEAQAINAGDALLALARLALARGELSPEVNGCAAGCLDEATLEMVEGQTLDLEFEGRSEVGVDEYLDMVGRKTGALFGCAMALGAMAAGGSDNSSAQYEALGRRLGVGFQVRDDILGVWGDERRTGKPAGADLRRRKKSLPVVVALAGFAAETVRGAYSATDVTETAANELALAMEREGVRDACMEIADRVNAEARAIIDGLEMPDETREELLAAARFLDVRDF